MKAIILTKYGSPDVLQFKEVEKPAPGDGEILVMNAHCGKLYRGDYENT